MATTFQKYVASLMTPEQQTARDLAIARSLVADAQYKAAVTKPFRDSFARGLEDAGRCIADNRAALATMKKRRQGCTPDAASAVAFVEDTVCSHEDIEFLCAKCDSDQLTLGARHGADEYGIDDSEPGAYCADCNAFGEYYKFALPAATLRRILEAVAA
jgi:hypothetical protein